MVQVRSWSTSDTTDAVTSLTAGVYTVTVVDNNTGCVSIDTAIVTEGAKITVNVGTAEGFKDKPL